MGFYSWARRRARRASSYVGRRTRRAYRHARGTMRSYKRKYKSKVYNWKSKLKGSIPTEKQRDEYIETVSEEFAREIVEAIPEKIEDPTGEVREIILADVMREMKKLVDAEIVSGRKPKPKGPKMTDPQPDIP